MATGPSQTPFTIIDDADIIQKIVVIPTGSTGDEKIIGYAYTEFTGSSYDHLSGTHKQAIDIAEYTLFNLRLNRATNFYSHTYTTQDLFDLYNPSVSAQGIIDVYLDPLLNPSFSSLVETENQITKAIEVIIQNNTNKTAYLKLSYDPNTLVSSTDYSINIPPGVMYSSETKYAHMRHKIYFAEDQNLVGNVNISVAYNNNLLEKHSVSEPLSSLTQIISLATNVYQLEFSETPTIINEFSFTGVDEYSVVKIRGQARVSAAGQSLDIYITEKGSDDRLAELSGLITSTTPVDFNLQLLEPENKVYEVRARPSGDGEIGDARILYADLVYTNESVTP